MYDFLTIPKRYAICFILIRSIFTPVFPQVSVNEKGIYTLYNKELSFSISALTGGRIVSFTCRGEELLIQDDIHSKYYGATLWASPQRVYWPPSPVLDEFSYAVDTLGDKVRFVSQQDFLTGLCFVKEFYWEKEASIRIEYKIINISDREICVAPWDVARVKGGLTFFPVKENSLPELSSDLEHTIIEKDILWYVYSPDAIIRGQKLFATTREGWLAHLSGNLLFIKEFPEVDIEDLPPLQGEVEIFVASEGKYVELENHGKYTCLKPGESLTYSQRWSVIYVESEAIKEDRSLLVDLVRENIENRDE